MATDVCNEPIRIGYHPIPARETCALCETVVVNSAGPGLFLGGTEKPVCSSCGARREPELSVLLDSAVLGTKPGGWGSICIKQNTSSPPGLCPICGSRTEPQLGAALYVEGSGVIICEECGEKYAPGLLQSCAYLRDLEDFGSSIEQDVETTETTQQQELDELLAADGDALDRLREACDLVAGYSLNGAADETLQHIARRLACSIEVVEAQYKVSKGDGEL